jgi:hypothetical protein
VFIVDSQVHIWREETPDRPWVLVFEMLASGLAANPIVLGYHSGTKEGRGHRQNAFILAVDVPAPIS